MVKARILIVEDNGIIALDIQHKLWEMGYDAPAVATSGEEAIKLVAEIKPDLMLMNILLKGGMNGIDAAELIQHRFHVPIIFISGHPDTKILERAKKTEPYGFLYKPIDNRDLHSNIEIALYKHKKEQERTKRSR